MREVLTRKTYLARNLLLTLAKLAVSGEGAWLNLHPINHLQKHAMLSL
jgi:hypothetical protein